MTLRAILETRRIGATPRMSQCKGIYQGLGSSNEGLLRRNSLKRNISRFLMIVFLRRQARWRTCPTFFTTTTLVGLSFQPTLAPSTLRVIFEFTNDKLY